jgi:hypothetical protein
MKPPPPTRRELEEELAKVKNELEKVDVCVSFGMIM